MSSYSRSLGIISSLIAALLAGVIGVFFPLDNKIVYISAALLLSLSVVAMIISIKASIAREKRVFIDCGVAFGIMYAVLASIVYQTQIFIVLRGTLNSEQLEIVLAAPGRAFFLIDMFLYVLLGLATLFMMLAIDRNYKAFRILLGINSLVSIPGLSFPFLPQSLFGDASGQYSQFFILSTVAWCIIIIFVFLLAADYFRKQQLTPEVEAG